MKEKFDSISLRGPKPFVLEGYTDENTGYGRNEKRDYRVITAKEDKALGINPLEKWPSLNSLIEVTSERIMKSTGEISEEVRYYKQLHSGSEGLFLIGQRNLDV